MAIRDLPFGDFMPRPPRRLCPDATVITNGSPASIGDTNQPGQTAASTIIWIGGARYWRILGKTTTGNLTFTMAYCHLDGTTYPVPALSSLAITAGATNADTGELSSSGFGWVKLTSGNASATGTLDYLVLLTL